jgi:hypothetical protein
MRLLPPDLRPGDRPAYVIGLTLVLAQVVTRIPAAPFDATGVGVSWIGLLLLTSTALLVVLVRYGRRWARVTLAVYSILLAVMLITNAAGLGIFAFEAMKGDEITCGGWCPWAGAAVINAIAAVACGACGVGLLRSRALAAIQPSSFLDRTNARSIATWLGFILFGALPATALAVSAGFLALGQVTHLHDANLLIIALALLGIPGMVGLWIAALTPWQRTAAWLIAGGVLSVGFVIGEMAVIRRPSPGSLTADPGGALELLLLIAPLTVGVLYLIHSLRRHQHAQPPALEEQPG